MLLWLNIIQLNIVFGLNIWCFNVSERWWVCSVGGAYEQVKHCDLHSWSEWEEETHMGSSTTAVNGSLTSLRGDHSHFPQSSTQTSQWLQSSQEQHSNTDIFIDTCYSVKPGGCVYITHILSLKQLKSRTGNPAAGVARPTSPGANQCHGRLNTTPYVSYSLHSKCIKLIY